MNNRLAKFPRWMAEDIARAAAPILDRLRDIRWTLEDKIDALHQWWAPRSWYELDR